MAVEGCSATPAQEDGVAEDPASEPTNANTDYRQNGSSCTPRGGETTSDDRPLILEVIPAANHAINHEVGLIRSGVASWSVLAALLALHRWFTARSQRQDMSLQDRPLLTHDNQVHAEGSHDIDGLPPTIHKDEWTNVDRDDLQFKEQWLCHCEMHGASCAKVEELLGTIKRQEKEMKEKEQQAFLAQSKVNQLIHDKEQQTKQLIYWTEIAKNYQKDLHKVDAKIIKRKNPAKPSADSNNLAEIAALSQELREREEELRVKEEEVSSKLGNDKLQNVVDELRQQNEVLLQRNEELVVKFNSFNSYKSTSDYYEQELTKKEADLARRHNVQIEKLFAENEELKKRIQNWSESARHYENEYKKLLKINKGHSQHVVYQESLQKSRGFGDAQLQTHQPGAINSIFMRQQQHEPLHHHQHHACTSQLQYQIALTRQQEEEVAVLRVKVQTYEERYKELQNRMQAAERMVAQHALVDTALYQDDEATPALLQATADTVKSSISMCASSIFKFATERSLSINPSYFNASDEQRLDIKGHNKKQVVKMALQAALCEILFHSFESPTYSLSASWSNVPFEKPQALRKRRLELFQKLRQWEAVEICKHIQQFDLFVQEKAAFVVNKLCELLCHNSPANTPVEAQAVIANLVQSDLPNSSFHNSFLRLAKAVWLLHEVAFACEPASAEIFRVSANSSFMKEYMKENEDTQSKKLTHGEDEDKRRLVALMNVPGFTLRNSVIKSVVCCFDSLSAGTQVH